MVISIWLLVGFHPATRSVQSTPADNTRKRVWQYIEKERKKERNEKECGNGKIHRKHGLYIFLKEGIYFFSISSQLFTNSLFEEGLKIL